MVAVNSHMGHGDLAKFWKKQQGRYLAKLRTDAGLTQADISKALGYAWSSVVGTHEQGTTNLPPEHYVTFANAVGVDPKTFVQSILRWHNPWAWQVLFGSDATRKATFPDSTTAQGQKMPPRGTTNDRTERPGHTHRKATRGPKPQPQPRG